MVLVVNVRGLEEAGLTKSYNQEVVDYHLDPLPRLFVHLVSFLEVVFLLFLGHLSPAFRRDWLVIEPGALVCVRSTLVSVVLGCGARVRPS